MSQSSKHIKKVAGLLAVSAATVGIVSTQARAANQYWDLSSDPGFQAGAGLWDATGATPGNWGNFAAPGTQQVAWVQGSTAIFQTGGVNTVTLVGDVVAAGIQNINDGTHTIIGGAGTLTNSGSITVGGVGLDINTAITLSGTQTWNVNSPMSVSGNINGATFNLSKGGAATLTLGGNVTANRFDISGGGRVLMQPGKWIAASDRLLVGSSSMIQDGWDLNPVAAGVRGSLLVNPNGFYEIKSGNLRVSGVTTSRAAIYQSGGNVDSNGHFYARGGSDIAVYYMTGGTYTQTGGNFNASYDNNTRSAVTITNATFVAPGIGHEGNNSSSALNINQNGVFQIGGRVGAGGSVGANGRNINFNGGTLRYTGGADSFWVQDSALFDMYLLSGGGTIEITQNITAQLSEPLLAPTGYGISLTTYAIADGGSGYVGAPRVEIDNVPGATAVANMIPDGSGGLKVGSITITSPGMAPAQVIPTFTFIDGGAATTGTISATASTAIPMSTTANTDVGGLTKTGIGTLRLNNASTYGGPTLIREGTLQLSGNGSIDTSSGVTVRDGATFDITSKGSGYAVNGLGGGGTVLGANGQFLTIKDNGILSPGDSAGTLTISAGNLAIGAGVVYEYEIDGTTASPQSDRVSLTGANSSVSFAGEWTLKLVNLGNVDPDGLEFVLFTYAGADPTDLGIWSIDYGSTLWAGGEIYLDTDANEVRLRGLGVVPEPSAVALLSLAALPMLRRRRGV